MTLKEHNIYVSLAVMTIINVIFNNSCRIFLNQLQKGNDLHNKNMHCWSPGLCYLTPTFVTNNMTSFIEQLPPIAPLAPEAQRLCCSSGSQDFSVKIDLAFLLVRYSLYVELGRLFFM